MSLRQCRKRMGAARAVIVQCALRAQSQPAGVGKALSTLEIVVMTAIDRIKTQLSAAPVVLYMKGTPDFPECGFSAQTVSALKACKANFAHVNIFEDPEVREALKTY